MGKTGGEERKRIKKKEKETRQGERERNGRGRKNLVLWPDGAGFLAETGVSMAEAPEDEVETRGVIISLRKSSLLRLRFSPTSPSGGAMGLE